MGGWRRIARWMAACSALFLLAWVTSTPAAAVPNGQGSAYWVVDLGSLGQSSSPWDVSDRDQVVGYSFRWEPGNRAFRWERGVMTVLEPLPGHSDSIAYSVNSDGYAVGRSLLAGGDSRPVLWRGTGALDLGTLGGSSGIAQDINDTGWVVGAAATADGANRAFLWRDGHMTDLGALGGRYSGARAINASGWIAGHANPSDVAYHAVLWRDGQAIDLGTLGGRLSLAEDINDAGQVVGWAETPAGQRRAFLWQNGIMTDLGTLPGHEHSEARAIGRSGEVVGVSKPPQGGHWRAVLWRDGTITDLNSMLPSGSGWTLWAANAINGAGHITGTGVSPQGKQHGYLLTTQPHTPTPTPTSTPTATATPTATPTPTPTPAFTSTGSVSPPAAAGGTSVTIRTTLTSDRSVDAYVYVQVWDLYGRPVFGAGRPGMQFSPGVPREYTAVWQIPPLQAGGEYRVSISVYDPRRVRRYSSNSEAARFRVLGP